MGPISIKQSLPNQVNFHLLDYGYCKVWKRKLDQFELMEEYPVQIQTLQRLHAYQSMWPLRTKHPFIVNVHYFSHEKNSNLCGQLAKGSIFTERIPYRLCEFSNIPLRETLSMLKKAFQIYQILYETIGLFLVRSTMIGFTQNFQIKVWCHTDFSQPQPQNENCQAIHQMIQSIKNSIESVGEFCYNNYKFSDFVKQNRHSSSSPLNSFKMILKALNDFMFKIKIIPLEDFSSIILYKKQEEGWEKFKAKPSYPVFVSHKPLQQKQKQKQNNPFSNKGSRTSNINTFKQVNREKSIYEYLGDNTTNNSRIGNLNNEPNQRVMIIGNNSQKQTKQIMHKKEQQIKRILSPAAKGINFQNPHVSPNIRFWRSNDKIDIHTPIKHERSSNVLSSQNNMVVNSPNFKTINSKIPSNQYYGSVQTGKFLPIQKLQVNLNRNSTIYTSAQKSVQVSTTTQNFERASRSSISLIQDLEIKYKNVRRTLKFNKF